MTAQRCENGRFRPPNDAWLAGQGIALTLLGFVLFGFEKTGMVTWLIGHPQVGIGVSVAGLACLIAVMINQARMAVVR